MKTKHYFFILSLVIIYTISSCEKFLDITPSTGNVNPSTLKDFQEMLNSDSIARCNFILADLMADDLSFPAFARNEFYGNSYMYAQHIWGPGEMDFMYKSAYERILQMNILILKASEVKPKNEDEKKGLAIAIAQAKVNRAWYFLQLANIYGQDFTNGKAATELAIPISLVPDASVKPKRGTVQAVYDLVIAELTDAIATPDFPVMGNTIIHPGKASALALLSRTYLLMGNYAEALKAADECLALKSSILDYKTLTASPLKLLDQSRNPEVLLGKTGVDYDLNLTYAFKIQISKSLDSLFTSSDYRRTLNFDYYDIFANEDGKYHFNYSIAVPEVMLIKAESLARTGKPKEALPILNLLRKNRIENATDLQVADIEILPTVLQERRRELFCHGGLRLFDLKRLNREQRFLKNIVRSFYDSENYQDTTVAIIKPNSPRYLMEIAPLITNNNKDIIPNPR